MNEFTEQQKKKLLKNSNIEKVTNKHVVFKAKFKTKAVEKYLEGKSPKEIFIEAGIDLDMFTPSYSRDSIKKWKKKYIEHGKNSFDVERRGVNSTGRPKKMNLDDLNIAELKAMIEIQGEIIEELKKKKALTLKKKKLNLK